MIRATRSAVLLVAFYLLASVATVHAECAWVLWREFQDEQPQVVGAWNQRADCERRRPAEYPKNQEVPDSGRFLKIGRENKKDVFMRAFCLPDTMDPRGPKGGGL